MGPGQPASELLIRYTYLLYSHAKRHTQRRHNTDMPQIDDNHSSTRMPRTLGMFEALLAFVRASAVS